LKKKKTSIHQVEVRKEAFICLCKQKERKEMGETWVNKI
jgi:hypothetical protein